MSQKHEFYYRVIIILLTVILVLTLVQSPRATQAAPHLGAPSQARGVSVYLLGCSMLQNVTTTYQKVANLAAFTLNSADSLVEITYNGRIKVDSFVESGAGAYFELRVDNAASTNGTARAIVLWNDVGSAGVNTSITGFFSGLSKGDHTASIWVRTTISTATNAYIDPWCLESAVLIVEEHLPFGVTFMPLINK